MRKCLIITGGSVDISFASNFLNNKHWDFVIAADKGLEAAMELGVSIDYLIGDFDSVKHSVFDKIKNTDIKVLTYPAEKDAADTELALQTAIEYGAEEIVLLGATGTRLDHTIANIHILKQAYNAGVTCSIVDAHNRIRLVLPGVTRLLKKESFGHYISFIPLQGDVCQVRLQGFRYSGENINFCTGYSLGVSNEIAEDVAKICFPSGILVMIESRD